MQRFEDLSVWQRAADLAVWALAEELAGHPRAWYPLIELARLSVHDDHEGALRRLAIMQPIGAARCHAVHIALHQDFGEAGMGVEHVLRCIVVGLARTATRQLVIGEPGCAIVMADEATLLALMEGTTGHAALIAMAGTKDAVRLMPLFQAVSALLRS